jgi:polyisoprenoid-binding protein YceI
MRSSIAALCLSALALAPLPALAQAPAAPAAAGVQISVPSGAYELDNAHTSVIWRVSHFGLAMYTGRFNIVSGTLNFDAQAPEKSTLSVSIDANSIDTGHKAIKADSTFDAKIAKEALGAEKTPKIMFVSTAVQRTGDRTGKVTGNLTLNGQTKPVTLDVTFRDGKFISFVRKNMLGFAATGKFKRSEWGIANWAGAVGDEVELVIEAEFGRDAQPPAPANQR